MRKIGALDVLFPHRSKGKREFRLTRLQEALHTGLMGLMDRPEVQRGDGLTQFLPLLLGTLQTTSDDQIREGREMMRSLVQALDDADRITPDAATEETTGQLKPVASET